MPLTIRIATASDAPGLAALFHETVKTVNSRDYRPAQIEAWAGKAPDPAKWRDRLATRATFVAELAGVVVGFAELRANGHIDALYVHAGHQRKGIATALLARIEQEAGVRGIGTLFTDASITAEPFFVKRGFRIVEAQDVEYRGVHFRNYRMTRTPGTNNPGSANDVRRPVTSNERR